MPRWKTTHRTRSIVASLVSLYLLIPCSAVRTTWYGENVGHGSDIMMMSLLMPQVALASTCVACSSEKVRGPRKGA